MVPVIIVLLTAGFVLLLASFIFRDAFSGRGGRGVWTEDDIERLVERRFSEVKYRLDDEAEKSADQIKDQTERELEKLSNEKIMAVNEYSDQVMDQINKNHNEVMFLYSMLSDKQKELDNAVEKLNRFRQQAEAEERLAEHARPSKPGGEQKNMGKKPAKEAKKALPKAGQDEKYANKDKIFQMYEEGMSSTEIAKSLHLGVGEVRLVLELARGKKEEQ